MRILFFTKQQYMGKDLLRDRFGRFYELAKALASRGHDLCVVCLKYWDAPNSREIRRQTHDGIDWRSFELGWFWPIGFWRHWRRLHQIALEFDPDIVVGASDAVQVTMAGSVAARLGLPLALDLYDDFESYGATRLPGVRAGLRSGILQARAISTVSDNLTAKVQREYRPTAIVRTISNAVCPEWFQPGDKHTARCKLGLPQSGILIGTAGTLSPRRGIGTLVNAFEKIASGASDMFLILAGPMDRKFRLPTNARVRYLGELPHADVSSLFNALDVGVVYNRRDKFAEHCFPQKLYEMMACALPIVAADVGAMSTLLAHGEAALYDPENAGSLAAAIISQLKKPRVAKLPVPSWQVRGDEFYELLREGLWHNKCELTATFRDNLHRANPRSEKV